MKAPIYLHENGATTQISIERGIEIIEASSNRKYVIENISGTYGGDVTITADSRIIKFPAHYADALDMLEIINPTPRSWYIENGYLPPNPTLEDEIQLGAKHVDGAISDALYHINEALELQGKLDDMMQSLNEERIHSLIKIGEMIQSELDRYAKADETD